MKAGRGSKDKGIAFQHDVARDVARTFRWTVEALSPRSIGKCVGGVRYVSEQDAPDLRVRTMGASGADVIPLSARAAERFPFLTECKIRATLPAFWPYLGAGQSLDFLRPWVWQSSAHCALASGARPYYPLVVCRANLMAPLAVFPVDPGGVPRLLPQLFPRALLWPEGALTLLTVGFAALLDVLADAACRGVLFDALAVPPSVEQAAVVADAALVAT
jgi:hypothetical protein